MRAAPPWAHLSAAFPRRARGQGTAASLRPRAPLDVPVLRTVRVACLLRLAAMSPLPPPLPRGVLCLQSCRTHAQGTALGPS